MTSTTEATSLHSWSFHDDYKRSQQAAERFALLQAVAASKVSTRNHRSRRLLGWRRSQATVTETA